MREERPSPFNQNDPWHAGKSILRAVQAVGKGTVRTHNIKWNEQLSDKASGCKTAVGYAIRNCANDPANLRAQIDNIPCHYSNDHRQCSEQARCRTDPNYEPSKDLITDEGALVMLQNVLRHCVVYTNAQDYVHAIDTYYVESYNNVLNVYHDKRIVFGTIQYKMRTDLTTLDWNENVNRDYTSVWQPPRGAGKPKKNYQSKKFNFKQNIWDMYMNHIYVNWFF